MVGETVAVFLFRVFFPSLLSPFTSSLRIFYPHHDERPLRL